MCKAVEEYARRMSEERIREAKPEWILEGKIETIKNLLKENISLELALKCAELDKDTYDKYTSDMQ